MERQGEPETVFITGTSRGVGLGLVKAFLSLPSPPVHLFASCIDPNNEEASELRHLASSHPELTLIKLDVQSDTDIASAVRQTQDVLGERGLTLLINNAAINSGVYGIESLSRDDIISHFDCNSAGPLLVTKGFLALLRKASNQMRNCPMSCNKAAVMNLSTGQILPSKWLPGEFRYSYVMSKVAITTATKMLSNELEADGILVVAIAPGWVKTAMGGPDAQITVEESASYMLKTFAILGSQHKGTYYGYAPSV